MTFILDLGLDILKMYLRSKKFVGKGVEKLSAQSVQTGAIEHVNTSHLMVVKMLQTLVWQQVRTNRA